MHSEIGLKDKLFNLAEARDLMPLVQAITAKHQTTLAPVQARLSKMLSNDPRRVAVERDYEAVVSQWRSKIELLGARVSGLWVVEFNVGEGWLCWRYPELTLNYFRYSHDAFADRIALHDHIEETDPDWAC